MNDGRAVEKQNKLNWKESIRFRFEQEKKKWIDEVIKVYVHFQSEKQLTAYLVFIHVINEHWGQKYLHVFENLLSHVFVLLNER